MLEEKMELGRPDGFSSSRQFTLVNRDHFPLQDKLDMATPCQIVVAPGTAAKPRGKPAFFAVDQRVTDPEKELRLRFETFAETRLGPSFLLSMPGGSVLTEGFFVVDQVDNLLVDSFRAYGQVGRYGFEEVKPRVVQRDFPPSMRHRGSAIVLGIQTNTNYFHWLMEALPRLWLAQRFLALEDSTVLVPDLTPWMQDMLAAAGAVPERLAFLSAEATSWERLVMPARGLANIHTFTWHALELMDMLRGQANHVAAAAGRRLFVSRERSASRRIGNEDELFAIAEGYGFTRVFPQDLNFADQLALFAGAEAVAGALGAGLANAAFLAPGGSLIEFAPEQRDGDAVLFANLAHHRRLRYAGVVGPFCGDQNRAFDRRDFLIPTAAAADAFAAIF
jgi:hypothetical protein